MTQVPHHSAVQAIANLRTTPGVDAWGFEIIRWRMERNVAAWRRQHSIEIFLPIDPAPKAGGHRELFEALKARLASRHGGVTAYVQTLAEGLWVERGAVSHDRIVVLEVLVDEIDTEEWSSLKSELERRLDQREILIRVQTVNRLL